MRSKLTHHAARMFRFVFYLSSTFVLLDFLMNVIWLPIGAHNTWGFRTPSEAFLATYNGTGAPAGWNWCLSYLATAGILIGFDASGHIAEETKNASLTAARGIFWSTVVSGIGAACTIVLFLFCAVSIHGRSSPFNLLEFELLAHQVLFDSPILRPCSLSGPRSHLSLYMLLCWAREPILL